MKHISNLAAFALATTVFAIACGDTEPTALNDTPSVAVSPQIDCGPSDFEMGDRATGQAAKCGVGQYPPLTVECHARQRIHLVENMRGSTTDVGLCIASQDATWRVTRTWGGFNAYVDSSGRSVNIWAENVPNCGGYGAEVEAEAPSSSHGGTHTATDHVTFRVISQIPGFCHE